MLFYKLNPSGLNLLEIKWKTRLCYFQDYEKDFQDFFDFEGIFFFLLGILGGVLAVVLGLVIVQQGRECLDWLQRRRRSLSRPPSYNTVSKPPRYSLCGEETFICKYLFIWNFSLRSEIRSRTCTCMNWSEISWVSSITVLILTDWLTDWRRLEQLCSKSVFLWKFALREIFHSKKLI